jgi:hypothetical protein
VDYEFKAGLTQYGPLTFASLMAGGLENTTFRPRLTFGPLDGGVAGYLEFYGTLPSGAVLSAKLEIARSENGPALAGAPGSVLGAAEATRFVATGGVPLTGLAPGDYLLRVVISVNDKPVGQATRTIRKLS